MKPREKSLSNNNNYSHRNENGNQNNVRRSALGLTAAAAAAANGGETNKDKVSKTLKRLVYRIMLDSSTLENMSESEEAAKEEHLDQIHDYCLRILSR
jgi:hypothetical protein